MDSKLDQLFFRFNIGIEVYKSYNHNNTERIALAMAEAAGAKAVRLEDAKPFDLEGFDLIGFGSGIYYVRHHKELRAFIERLPLQDKPAFIFSTCGAGQPQHRALRKLLEKKGFRIKGHFTCKGLDTFGPFILFGGMARNHPGIQDIEVAKAFARKMCEQ